MLKLKQNILYYVLKNNEKTPIEGVTTKVIKKYIDLKAKTYSETI